MTDAITFFARKKELWSYRMCNVVKNYIVKHIQCFMGSHSIAPAPSSFDEMGVWRQKDIRFALWTFNSIEVVGCP